MSQKRTIDSFFSSAPKRPRNDIFEERTISDEQDEIVRLNTYNCHMSHLFVYLVLTII